MDPHQDEFDDRQTLKKKQMDEPPIGFTLLSVLTAICGLRLKIYPLDGTNGSVIKFLLMFNSIIVTFSISFCVFNSGYVVSNYASNFKLVIFMASKFLGTTECLFRVLFTLLKKHKIDKMSSQIKIVVRRQTSKGSRSPFMKRISRCLVASITVIFTVFIVSAFYNYLASFGKLGEVLDEMQKNNSIIEVQTMLDNQVPIDIIEAWFYVSPVFSLWQSIAVLKIFAAAFYAINFLAVGRVILTDMLFYSWYFIIIHKYRELARDLKVVLDVEKDNSQLKTWIELHHLLNELLGELNMLTAPVIIVSVILAGLQICIMSFSVLKLSSEVNNSFMIVLGLSSVHHIFMYCIIGQKIRNEAKSLNSEAYTSSWLENNPTKQHAALMICSVANEKVGQCLPGAPFFALSLEFFASMLGVIITYFVILLQFHQ